MDVWAGGGGGGGGLVNSTGNLLSASVAFSLLYFDQLQTSSGHQGKSIVTQDIL